MKFIKCSNKSCQRTFWSSLRIVYGYAMLHNTELHPKRRCTQRYAPQKESMSV